MCDIWGVKCVKCTYSATHCFLLRYIFGSHLVSDFVVFLPKTNENKKKSFVWVPPFFFKFTYILQIYVTYVRVKLTDKKTTWFIFPGFFCVAKTFCVANKTEASIDLRVFYLSKHLLIHLRCMYSTEHLSATRGQFFQSRNIRTWLLASETS